MSGKTLDHTCRSPAKLFSTVSRRTISSLPFISCFPLSLRQSCPKPGTALRSSFPLRACGKDHLLLREFPQVLKGFFKRNDAEVCVLGDPRCGDLLRSKEELVGTPALPDATCFLEPLY